MTQGNTLLWKAEYDTVASTTAIDIYGKANFYLFAIFFQAFFIVVTLNCLFIRLQNLTIAPANAYDATQNNVRGELDATC